MTSVASRQEHDSGDYSDSSHQEIDPDVSGNDGGQQESDYESAGSDSERSGDPDAQEAERRVDDDEDRSNPQYIPKRGTFYEHDDRTAASGEELNNTASETTAERKEGSETPSERRRPPRKSDTNKWSHDKYNENEQAPKSRDELVAIYGYDIRNEDAPPHARRNRRYGRGPNKYTRTWEDEEAYKRQAAAAPAPRKPPTAEDFPELDSRNNKKRIPRPRSKSQPSSNESIENGTPLRRNASTKKATPRQAVVRMGRQNDRGSVKEKLPEIENLSITATIVKNSQGTQVQRKANVTVAQQRPVPTEQAKKKPPPLMPSPIQNNAAPNKSPPQQQQPAPPQKQQSNQQQQQPAAGPESRGSKRYSSLRQRPLDTYCPPQNQQQQQMPQQQQQLPPQQQQQQLSQQQQSQQQQQQAQQLRYHAEFQSGPNQGPTQQQGPAPQIHPQQMMQQMHRNVAVSQPSHGPSPPHQIPQQMPPHSQQVRIGILEQQQLVQHQHHSMHNIQQQHIGQLQQAQGYAPPAMMPAQYMQQPQASGAVFGAAPMYAQPPAPYPHQMYTPHHNYAPAGGVTYFTCAEQEQPRTQRRPTAAIPIVRPQANERPANSSEKDNIDRIVENMFVRKPWPSTHGAESKETKSDARNSQEPPSKESSQPNSLTSSSISTDSKPSEPKDEVKDVKEVKEVREVIEVREVKEEERDTKESEATEVVTTQESIATEA